MPDKSLKLRGKHSIMVVELDSQRENEKASLYVTSSSQSPEKFIERLIAQQDELSLPGRPIGLRQELVPGYRPSRSKNAIQRRLTETRERLHQLGFDVFPRWRIYVLDVDPDKPHSLLDRGMRNQVVYVGQTSREIETRLLEHQGLLRGDDGRYLGGPSIEGRSPVVNWRLTLEELLFSRENALILEADYAARLKDDGYRVLGDGLTNDALRTIASRD